MIFSFFKYKPKSFDQGYLPEIDGHNIFYQQFGNPNGKIILSFHGGPGGCSKIKHCLHYNLKTTRIIMFDQRGCGQSTAKNIHYKNSTHDLLNDAVRLLHHLNIKKKIIVAGGSWGSTLALLFAEKYPERVSKLILNSIFLADKTDREWMEKDSRLFYPDLIEQFQKEAGSKNIGKYFAKLILSPHKKDNEKALKSYGSYEKLLGSVNPKLPIGPFVENDMAYPRIFFHYDNNHYFITPNEIIKKTDKIAHIPTLIFHNRLDMSCPLCGAWDLHKALPKSKLFIIPNHGHGSKLMFDTMKEKLKTFI